MYTKRAVKRDPTVPMGQPGACWIDCECGLTLHIAPDPALEHPCTCGITYDARGWITKRPSRSA
jgi:hypothetical protein